MGDCSDILEQELCALVDLDHANRLANLANTIVQRLLRKLHLAAPVNAGIVEFRDVFV